MYVLSVKYLSRGPFKIKSYMTQEASSWRVDSRGVAWLEKLVFFSMQSSLLGLIKNKA